MNSQGIIIMQSKPNILTGHTAWGKGQKTRFSESVAHCTHTSALTLLLSSSPSQSVNPSLQHTHLEACNVVGLGHALIMTAHAIKKKHCCGKSTEVRIKTLDHTQF
jgi:hypothetical protein